MKKRMMIFTGMFALAIMSTTRLEAQSEAGDSKFSVGADLYSNYIWRGTKFGKGPAVQPTVKYVTGGLTVGVWGSFDASGYAEADPYFSYTLPFGLSLGMTDYYYPGTKFFEVSDTAGSHAFELNAGFAKAGVSLSANYILNQAGAAGSVGGDMYFQAGYSFTFMNIFIGAGDGWHTSDGNFAICNLGIGTSKSIKLSDTFSIPVSGQIILNPDKEQFIVVVGFSF